MGLGIGPESHGVGWLLHMCKCAYVCGYMPVYADVQHALTYVLACIHISQRIPF